MALYKVIITEIRRKSVRIDADYSFEAIQRAEELYKTWPNGLEDMDDTSTGYYAEKLLED